MSISKALTLLNKTKIQLNCGNPIKMKLFLSFLAVETTRSKSHLGSANGWTQYHGNNNLVIRGGLIEGVDYLDTIQYGRRLDNPYNNYVNPFYLLDIMTDDGKQYFLRYYQDDVAKILKKSQSAYEQAKRNLCYQLSEFRELGFIVGDFND